MRRAIAIELLTAVFATACAADRPAVTPPLPPPASSASASSASGAAPGPSAPVATEDAGGTRGPAAPPADELASLRADLGMAKSDREVNAKIFQAIGQRADPRLADDLAAYLAASPPPRWRTQAALRLGELGDLRAAPHLSWRLKQDPLKLYTGPGLEMMRHDDNERIVSARLLADLAKIHPAKKADLLAAAGEAMLFWANDKPQPHGNALRFLAAVESPAGVARMRGWADPSTPLPKPGAMPLAIEFATAQSALRWVGAAKDAKSWDILVKQLGRRPAGVDTTMNALVQGGNAVLGMALRALAIGAAHGFAEWGDPRAQPILAKYIEEPRNNEQARMEVCRALAWVSTDAQMVELAKKAAAVPGTLDQERALVRACRLAALQSHPAPGADAILVPLLGAQADEETRDAAAAAIGAMGVDASALAAIEDDLKDALAKHAAAAALLLGADTARAKTVLAKIDTWTPHEQDEAKNVYNRALSSLLVTDRAYDGGHLARWVRNATATPNAWTAKLLARTLRDVEFDNGPHTLTRTVLRARLYADARGADATKRDDAIAILELMREEGVLHALGRATQLQSDGGS